jgi:hypothetical protein
LTALASGFENPLAAAEAEAKEADAARKQAERFSRQACENAFRRAFIEPPSQMS